MHSTCTAVSPYFIGSARGRERAEEGIERKQKEGGEGGEKERALVGNVGGGGRRRKEAFCTSCFLPAASLVSFHMATAEKEGREGGTEEADSFRPYASGGGGDDRMPIPNSIDVSFQVHDPLLPPERRRLPRRLHQVALHDHAPVGGVPEGKVDAGGKIGFLSKYPGMLLQTVFFFCFSRSASAASA